MMKRSFVKSDQPIVFFFAVIFSITFLFCSVSYADVIYISSDDCSVNYIREDSAGNFHESKDVLPRITNQTVMSFYEQSEKYPYYSRIFAFRRNNQNRFLITKRITSSDVQVMVYNMEDFSAPLASKNFEIRRIHDGGFAELGNNIIIGHGATVYEMNPETCELVGEPYLMTESTGAEVEVYVHDGLIYAAIDDGQSAGRLDIMDNVGSVTGGVSFGSEPHKYTPEIVSSGGNLYFSGSEVFRYSFEHGSGEFFVKAGIYLIHHDKIKNFTLTADDLYHNSNYSTQVISNDVVSFCSDGQGGFYYLLSDDMIQVNEYSYDPVGRVGKYRLTVFLQQVCTSLSPNRAYPSQGTRLSIYGFYE